MTDVKVEQCDRDAAALLIEGRSDLISSSQPDWCAIDQKMFREGAKDAHPFVQAFARHRQAAEKATRERDAGICEKVAADWGEKTRLYRSHGNNGPYLGEPTGWRLATAIRSQNDDR